jgi:hypothetical protein
VVVTPAGVVIAVTVMVGVGTVEEVMVCASMAGRKTRARRARRMWSFFIGMTVFGFWGVYYQLDNAARFQVLVAMQT